MTTADVRSRTDYYRGIISDLRRQLRAERGNYEASTIQHGRLLEAHNILVTSISVAQQTVKEKIERLVTAAIQTVYDRDFRFELRFNQQRNRSNAVPIVKEGDIEYDAKEDLGGGMLDVISFALRVVVWSMRGNLRPTMLLDEPMKFVGTGELMTRAASFIKSVSFQLGLQLIINTHDHQLAEIADKTWDLQYENRETKVEERN